MTPVAKPARFPVEIIDECDSTNRVLADRVRSGNHDPVLLVARHQTAGRGRLGRTWEAPVGSAFTGSWLVPVTGTRWAAQPWLLSVAVALAVDATLGEFGVALTQVSLKWPNDVMSHGGHPRVPPARLDTLSHGGHPRVPPARLDPLSYGGGEEHGEHGGHPASSHRRQGDRKLCGILAEYVATTGAEVVVVGAGINVTRPVVVEGVLAERGIWVSELLPASAAPSVDALIPVLNHQFARLVDHDGPRADLLTAYRGRCSTLGRRVRVEQLSSSFEGLAIDIDSDGALVVVTDAGEERRVTVADVVHLHSSEEELS
jgi:BirA family transcriptional regulator, biotin operon repressor / biotin---[acetyl-CoA-carboxylase] ligase